MQNFEINISDLEEQQEDLFKPIMVKTLKLERDIEEIQPPPQFYRTFAKKEEAPLSDLATRLREQPDAENLELDLRFQEMNAVVQIFKLIHKNQSLIKLNINLSEMNFKTDKIIQTSFSNLTFLKDLTMDLSKVKIKDFSGLSIAISTLNNLKHINLDISYTKIRCLTDLFSGMLVHKHLKTFIMSIEQANIKLIYEIEDAKFKELQCLQRRLDR